MAFTAVACEKTVFLPKPRRRRSRVAPVRSKGQVIPLAVFLAKGWQNEREYFYLRIVVNPVGCLRWT